MGLREREEKKQRREVGLLSEGGKHPE